MARRPAPTKVDEIAVDTAIDTPAPVAVADAPTPAPTESTAVAPVSDYADDLGSGFEDTTGEDLKVPLITAIQSNNPQVMPGHAKYLAHAKPSMLLNTLTGETHDGAVGVEFIPVRRVRQFMEFVPRTQGGGVVARHDPNEPAVKRARAGKPYGKIENFGDGNELVESVNVYGLLIDAQGKVSEANVPFQSTNIDAYKTMYSIALAQRVPVGNGQTAPLPLFAHRWRLRTTFAQNKKGQWFKLVLTPAAETIEASRLAQTDPLYQRAKAFDKLIHAGRVTDNFDDAAKSDIGTGEDGVEDI